MNMINISPETMRTLHNLNNSNTGAKISQPRTQLTYGGGNAGYSSSASYTSSPAYSLGGGYSDNEVNFEEMMDPTKKLLHGARAWKKAGKYTSGRGTYG